MCRVLEIIYKNIFADGGWSHLVESVEKLSVVHNGESTVNQPSHYKVFIYIHQTIIFIVKNHLVPRSGWGSDSVLVLTSAAPHRDSRP